MKELLSDDTKAIIMLCGFFGNDCSQKLLTHTEYTLLARWLVSVNLRPGDLLNKDHLEGASKGSGIDRHRLETLLSRGVQLGFAVEEWQRNGIWLISRSDPDYPNRYKKHLKEKSPPLLYGVGSRSLLSGGGLAIVGSRNVDKDGEAFTNYVAKLCVMNGIPIISGGARGVDRISMIATLEAGGRTIGILAENLLKKSVERVYRNAIADGKLLLISPYYPNARFTVGNAMGRNKLIYAMADYGLVVSAEHNRGGTWSGAIEELKRENHRPVFVRTGHNSPPGNIKLTRLGALPWPVSVDDSNLNQQLCDLSEQGDKEYFNNNLTLFESQKIKGSTPRPEEGKEVSSLPNNKHKTINFESNKASKSRSIYEAVLPLLLNELEEPATLIELAESLNVNKAQLSVWIKKALSDKKIMKLSKPVRYQKAISNDLLRL